MQRPLIFTPDNFYHIYNRGVERRYIFLDDNDRTRFQRLLYLANGQNPIVYKRVQGDSLDRERGKPYTSLIAYSMMTNHFHIIAKETDNGGITAFMKKLSTAYSMYFNKKNDRTGALVCRPFKAKHIDTDDYFRWVMSYVHLNPLDLIESGWKQKGIADKKKAIDFLKTYQYSSYADYFGAARPEAKIIDKIALPIDASVLENFETMLKEFADPYERPDLEIW